MWLLAATASGIASGSADDTVRMWDAATGQPIGKSMTGHKNDVMLGGV